MVWRIFTFLKLSFILCAMAVSSSFAKPDLTIYTYDSFTSEWGPGPAIEQAFEKICDCDLQMVGLESSLAAWSRLQLEGDKTTADIILGLDTASMEDAKISGLLQPHNIKADNLSLPIKWNDEIFLPYDYGYFSFIYDKRRVKNPPKSMKAFVENKDNLKIVYADGRFSTTGLGLVLWVKHIYGDKAAMAWEKIAKHVIAVPPSWSSAYQLLKSGETDLMLSYTTSPAYDIIVKQENHYAFAPFSEGHYMQIETAAMTKNADKALARKFLKFMLEEEFQKLIPQGNWMFPVIDIEIPTAFGKAPRALLFSSKAVKDNRKAWLKEWQNSMSR